MKFKLNYYCRYPVDSNTYNIDHQFLWGDALLISPVLEKVGIVHILGNVNFPMICHF